MIFPAFDLLMPPLLIFDWMNLRCILEGDRRSAIGFLDDPKRAGDEPSFVCDQQRGHHARRERQRPARELGVASDLLYPKGLGMERPNFEPSTH